MILAPLIVLAVLSIGPGFVIVGRLHWRPLETLAASIGLSWIIVYLAAFLIYAWGLPNSLHLVLFCFAAIAVLACGRGLWRLFRPDLEHPSLRGITVAFQFGERAL